MEGSRIVEEEEAEPRSVLVSAATNEAAKVRNSIDDLIIVEVEYIVLREKSLESGDSKVFLNL